MRERLQRERIYVYIWLIHVVVQQKLIQHCKAIILQIKKEAKADTLTLFPIIGESFFLWVGAKKGGDKNIFSFVCELVMNFFKYFFCIS